MLLSFGFIAVYVVLVGIASFAEKLVSASLDAFELNAAVRAGVLALALPAVLVAHGVALPTLWSVLAGFGIGVLAGVGVLFYFLALKRLPVWLVVCLADGYILITAFLGILVLGEAATAGRIAGLLFTVAGIVLLSYDGEQAGGEGRSGREPKRLLYLACMAPYIALLGASSFLEKPALRHLDPLQLNALVSLGMNAVALPVLLVRDRSIPLERSALKGMGIGCMIGLATIFYYLGLVHLPVSVGATLANTYVVVTVLLAIVVRHRSVTALKIGAIVTLIAGVVLLTIRVHI